MRNPRIGLCVLVAGCWRGSPDPISYPDTPRSQPGLFTISSTGVGPIHADTPATLDALRHAFPDDRVEPVNSGTLEYDVFAGDERLLYVVPNDDGSVFNVQVTSAKIGVSDRSWRVGQQFHGAMALSACECWGPNPTCYKIGDHIAVSFGVECDGSAESTRGFRWLEGVAIKRVIWSPSPFGANAYGGSEYGGDSYGGEP